MPFRLWFYLLKIGVPVIFAIVFITFASPGDGMLGQIRDVAVYILIFLGFAGAAMGVLMVFGKLRMRCPFCGKSGEAGGNKQDGLCMVCESCGFIHGDGPLKLKIVREELDNDESR